MEQYQDWFEVHIEPLGPDAWSQHATSCTVSNLDYLSHFYVTPVDAQFNDDGGIKWRLSPNDADSLATSLVTQGFTVSSLSGSMHNGDVGTPNTDYRSLTTNTSDRSVQIVIGPEREDLYGKYRLVYVDTDAFNPNQSVGSFVGHAFFEVLPGLLGFNTSCLGR